MVLKMNHKVGIEVDSSTPPLEIHLYSSGCTGGGDGISCSSLFHETFNTLIVPDHPSDSLP